jgi:NADPH:quinone reductase-like Zn-dependent oxidoreductase
MTGEIRHGYPPLFLGTEFAGTIMELGSYATQWNVGGGPHLHNDHSARLLTAGEYHRPPTPAA